MKIRQSTVWLSVIVIFTLGTFYISSLSTVPKAISDFWTPSDGVLHALEYGLLTWCTLMYFHTIHYTTRKRIGAYAGAFFFSGIVGVLNELWQMHVPHRGLSGSDVLSNFIGAALFIGLFHLLKMRKTKSVHKH